MKRAVLPAMWCLTILLTGCESSHENGTRRVQNDDVKYPLPPVGMPLRMLEVAAFEIAPTVVIPPEMSSISRDELAKMAQRATFQECTQSQYFLVDRLGQIAPPHPEKWRLEGVVTVIDVSVPKKNKLEGAVDWMRGDTDRVTRSLKLTMEMTLFDHGGRAVAASSSTSDRTVVISVRESAGASGPSASGDASFSMEGGQVTLADLPPAFRFAAGGGTLDIVNQLASNWQRSHATQERTPQ